MTNFYQILVLDLFHSLDRSVPVVALCVLKGGFQYFADVCDNLKRHAAAHYPEAIQFNMDFIRLKSYEGTFSIISFVHFFQMTAPMKKCKSLAATTWSIFVASK